MTLAEEIFDEMKCGRSAMFVIGLAAIATRQPGLAAAALADALKMYQLSKYHELGPAASAAANLDRSKNVDRSKRDKT